MLEHSPPRGLHYIASKPIFLSQQPYIIAAVLRSDEVMLEENIRLGGNPNMLNKVSSIKI